MDLASISKYMIYLGAFLLFGGSILYFLSKLGTGLNRLPGDIFIQKENFTFYFPLGSCILLSIIITLILSLLSKK